MKNIRLALLGFLLLTTPLVATAQQFGDFTYTSDGSAITITGYTGLGGDMAIPNTINGLPVTSIGNAAFHNQTALTSVTFPGSLKSIEFNAFGGCTGLTDVTIPGSVTSVGGYAFEICTSLTNVTISDGVIGIGADAFNNCINLTSVAIPASVVSIGVEAFYTCFSLAAITVDAANSKYSSLDGILFDKNRTMLIQCPALKAGSYSIPSGVTSIGYEAFLYCSSLTSITIPNSVTIIGSTAFGGCSGLKNLVIPSSVKTIGDSAFYSCPYLTRVFFEGNAPSAGLYVFYGTYNTVYYLPGTTGWGATFAGRPAVLWNPLMQSSGVGPAGFGFNITGTADIPIVVEAATNLASASWVPLQSLNLTNGAFYFSDPDWNNHPARFYRIRSP